MKYEESIVEALRANKAMNMREISALFPAMPITDKSNLVRRLIHQGRVVSEKVTPAEGRPYLIYKVV